jgi:predicted glycoside hydrolase/deacetylase ChbG (UPF0249 family)
LLILNADDWGRDRATTDEIYGCDGQLSSVSAMMFMADSERASQLALERGMEVGLHLNLTEPFSASYAPRALLDHQANVARFLLSHRLAQVFFHPGLVGAFEFVVRSQFNEFGRLYGASPQRFDGHHHLHLCANVIFQRLFPPGTVVRRNFCFKRGEKSFLNRGYRRAIDALVSRHYRVVDCFVAIDPALDSDQAVQIHWLRKGIVEVAVHPIERKEYHSLQRLLADPVSLSIASPAEVRAWVQNDDCVRQ